MPVAGSSLQPSCPRSYYYITRVKARYALRLRSGLDYVYCSSIKAGRTQNRPDREEVYTVTKEQQLDMWRREVPQIQQRIADTTQRGDTEDMHYYKGQLAMLERVIHHLEYDLGLDKRPAQPGD